ncbi:cyclic peptide export ABC transporter [Desulfopila sp. IMCC35008]|uniref:cyclic peptide export ABC transporter n=1 Tax=Desulfopila sp. IMCC35008 TaxID=2653858 RepID=UPI0013D63947|nr:cyclic peptide export ABC transporter [Desulfopila sp. IMCC35008]
MNLYTLYKRETTIPGTSVVAMAVVSGVANAVLLAIINTASKSSYSAFINQKFFWLFGIALALFLIGKKYALEKATEIAENIIRGMRVRLSDKIRQSELLDLEGLGKSDIYNRITQDTEIISQAALMIINGLQSSVMLFFCILYLAVLSKIALVMTLFSVIIAALVFLHYEKKVIHKIQETKVKENVFLDKIQQIIHGFKELKLSKQKNDHHFQTMEKVAVETEVLKVDTQKKYIIGFLFSQTFFYLLIAAVLFLLPKLDDIKPQLIIQITTSILFIIGPIEVLVNAIPFHTKADVAIARLYSLEESLDTTRREKSKDQPVHPACPPINDFQTIEFNNVYFHYPAKDPANTFSVGPIDFTLQKGEILFLIGGNGSGKSTLLKLITGLYYPVSGELRIDGRQINYQDYPAFRELFSAIFDDFFLFDHLYGMDEIPVEQVQSLLQLMQLENKVEFVDGSFSDINLSTGQRKRLAMIVSLLDDKPICVYDEWAADQDPEFREYFYKQLLDDLKAQGKTLIAVSHDDRYFSDADRVIKMDYGKMTSLDQV